MSHLITVIFRYRVVQYLWAQHENKEDKRAIGDCILAKIFKIMITSKMMMTTVMIKIVQFH